MFAVAAVAGAKMFAGGGVGAATGTGATTFAGDAAGGATGWAACSAEGA